MKRIIIVSILFAMFGILNAGASNTQFSVSPQAITVNNEGGKFTVTITQKQTDNEACYKYQIGGYINVQDSGGYMTGYSIESPNNMVFTLRPRDTASYISGDITVICSLTRTDQLEMRPIIGPIDSQLPIGGNENDGGNDYYECVSYIFSISYNYFTLWELFGGVIEDDDKIYEEGQTPTRINSVSPAVCGQKGDIVYIWEKKVGNGSWEEIENSNYDSYKPDIMGYQSVLYRRKAMCGSYTEYSNTVEKKAMLNAGYIGMEYMDTSSVIFLSNTHSPSVANDQLFWESSVDLDSWTKIATGRLTMQVDKPAVTTYYRRAASSLDGKTVRYSNVVCFSKENPVYISKKISIDRLGRSSIEDITYYDGLGRPMQSVGVNAASSGADAVTVFSYDGNGRQAYNHLPIAVSDNEGSFVRNAEYKAEKYYQSMYNKRSSVYPYTQTEFDGSPLSRVVRTFRQGPEYQADSDHFVSYYYSLNDTDEVRKLSVDNYNTLSVGEFYPKGELYKNTVIDEDGNMRITFTDTYGHNILSRQYAQANGNIDTYYVYDKCDRLRWVVSPEGCVQLAQGEQYTIDGDFAKKYCYRYVFGSNGLVSERHIPGQDGPEMLYYDEMNRVDSLTTAASRAQGISYTYKYDNLGRISRICANVTPLLKPRTISVSRDITPTIAVGSFDTSVYHYDAYDNSGDFASHDFIPVDGVLSDDDKYDNTVGQKTQEKIYEVFDKTRGKNRDYLCRTYYYDVRKRIIQTVETDSRGYMLRTSYSYDYVGNILSRSEQYTVDSTTTDVCYDYTYDTRGRITGEAVSIDGQPQTNVTNGYDDIGRLKAVMFGDKITTAYSYNIQGWLTRKDIDQNIELPHRTIDLNPDITFETFGNLFEETLIYFNPVNAAPSYNGNIAEMEWMSSSGSRNCRYAYAYTYDELGRMTNADLHIRSGSGIVGMMDGERNISYDRNGNIIHFERGNSLKTLYKYDRTFLGNRLINSDMCTETNKFTLDGQTVVVSDPVPSEFGYDSMGNISSISGDDNLEIKYNFLNLPKEMVKTTMERDRFGQMKIRKTYNYNRYLSDGTKVSSSDASGNGYMYIGTARFTLENNVPTFESIPFSGGRIVKTTNGYEPQYYLTDHLGSTRMIVNKDGQTVEAAFDYTPFGVQCADASTPTSMTEYRFSGKELQNIPDSEIYDFGARQYFPKYAIWGSVDPLANAFPAVSPYIYCSNNPLNRVDSDGCWDVSVHLYNDRAKYGYGIAVVTDRHGDEVFRFVVRAEGVGGHNRYKEKADTPLGIYNISKNYTWIKGKSRKSYGPNYRLNMEPLEGEIVATGRTLIRIHGGRQEYFNEETGQWEKLKDPELLETEGCLRAWDDDMIKFKSITDLLQEKDSYERPGKVRITDDLNEEDVYDNYATTSIRVTYSVPDNELDYWKKYISDFLNKKR